MRTLRIPLIAAATAASALLVLGQPSQLETLERNFRPHVAQQKVGGGQRLHTPKPRVFHIGGSEYRAWIAGGSL